MLDLEIVEHQPVISSMEVAELVDKRHDNLLRDIGKYVDVLTKANLKIEVREFFIPSTYLDAQKQERPCYSITRKGCDMIANKMTGDKGIIFTAAYVTRFEQMSKALPQFTPVAEDPKLIRAKAMLLNATVRRVKEMKMALREQGEYLSFESRRDIAVAMAEELVGKKMTPATPLIGNGHTYTAGDVGKMFGVTAQRIGRISEKNKLKTDEFGQWIMTKAPHSEREVATFVYNDRAVDKFRELIVGVQK